MSSALPSLIEIEIAAALIAPHYPPTPAHRWPMLEQRTGVAELWLKHENHGPVGAFKLRGGLVYLHELKQQHPSLTGVIAATTGNHGQSIARAAAMHGMSATIVVPHGNNPEKNAAMRAQGAQLIEHGQEFQDALEHAHRMAAELGLHFVPSFHRTLVRGVATYGLELLRDVPQLDAVFVPIGLGSGLCGVAAARAALGLSQRTRLIGVVSAHAPAYARSWREGTFIEHASTTRVAEGAACRTPNADALQLIRQHADDIVEVTDEALLIAMRELVQTTHNLPEGAGALAYAALVQSKAQWQGQRIACVMSGGNASMAILREVLAA